MGEPAGEKPWPELVWFVAFVTYVVQYACYMWCGYCLTFELFGPYASRGNGDQPVRDAFRQLLLCQQPADYASQGWVLLQPPGPSPAAQPIGRLSHLFFSYMMMIIINIIIIIISILAYRTSLSLLVQIPTNKKISDVITFSFWTISIILCSKSANYLKNEHIYMQVYIFITGQRFLDGLNKGLHGENSVTCQTLLMKTPNSTDTPLVVVYKV